jgi:HK97 family phage prohead protease
MTELVEMRRAETLDVHYPERVIELLAVPYDEDAEVVIRGRPMIESVAPSAFAGVKGDVTVRRIHDAERPLGRVIRFHPGDARGLRTELRIAKTAEGDDVLALADEGLLSASVGFVVLPGGEVVSPDRRKRRIVKARLDHIGMTGDPAYAGARVLAVRQRDAELGASSSSSSTPLLDQIRLELRAEAAGIALPS